MYFNGLPRFHKTQAHIRMNGIVVIVLFDELELNGRYDLI